MKLVKHIPNALSIARIFLSLSLLLLTGRPWVFAAVYLLIGATDFFDGRIARRYNAESKLGSKLDAVGDSMLFGCAVISLLFLADLRVDAQKCLLTLSFAIIYKLANVVLTHHRFGQWNMMHTLMNKAVFATLYFYVPVFLLRGEINYHMILAITVLICLACFEETITLCKLEEYDVDCHGILGERVLRLMARGGA